MEKLYIEGSAKTPSVSFDGESGVLEMRGRSIPENSIEFFQPLIDWVDTYGSTPNPATRVDMKLEYFNTSSSKCILDLFKRLEKINSNDSQVLINWYYETDDEDMEEAGEDYAAIVGLDFKILEIDEI
ncbi:MAG: nuclear pore complex subunit [Fluviicola sp.]|nr:MAG: nuclear pore complex subunit [Fluviicola sp.]